MKNLEEAKRIQEEAKRKFPIGITFINTNNSQKVLKLDTETYRVDNFGRIYANGGSGFLYDNGIWAKVVSYEENIKKEIIEECNKKYPIGTMIKCVDTNGKIYTREPKEVVHKAHEVTSDSSNEFYVDMGIGYVYVNGIWAEIVSYPKNYHHLHQHEDEIVNDYLQF